MVFSKTNIKELVKILFGFNIICLVTFLLLNYLNFIIFSKVNLL